jgi:hypothetical protein
LNIGAPVPICRTSEHEEWREIMSVYDNLRDHLQRCDLQSLRMSFSEIENLIGRSLPPIARKWSEWWANGAWQTAGYDAEVNITEETVTFRRKKS